MKIEPPGGAGPDFRDPGGPGVATNQTSNLNTLKRLTTSEGEEKKEEVPLIAGLIDSQQPTVDEEGTENEPREQDMEH